MFHNFKMLKFFKKNYEALVYAALDGIILIIMKFCVHVKNKNSVQSNNGFLKIYKNNKTKSFFFF